MEIRFDRHPQFHRAAASMVGGSLLFGAGLTLASSSAAVPIAAGVLGIGAGMAVAYGKPQRLLLAGAATVPLFAMPPIVGALLLAAAALALCTAIGGPRGWRGVLATGVAALVALVGMWCAVRIGHARATELWSPMATNLAGAAAMGIVGTLAVLVRHIGLAADPIATARRALPGAIDPEVKTLVERALTIYGSAKVTGEDRALLEEGVVETLTLAKQTCDTKPAGESSDLDLAMRIGELDKRIAAAADAEARAQYASAKTALEDQQKLRAERSAARDRLVAKLHNQVATLEKFQLRAAN